MEQVCRATERRAKGQWRDERKLVSRVKEGEEGNMCSRETLLDTFKIARRMLVKQLLVLGLESLA